MNSHLHNFDSVNLIRKKKQKNILHFFHSLSEQGIYVKGIVLKFVHNVDIC